MGVDVNVIVGPWVTDDHEEWTVRRALDHSERFRLDAALVRHSIAVHYDPAEGNARLRDELAAEGDARLLPAYVLGPLDSGEHGTPADLPGRLAADGVRAVWLYPRSHGWSLTGPEASSLVDVLRRAGLPVFVDLDETEWADLDALAAGAPELDLVVCGVGYRTMRQLIAVLDRRPRIHLDLSYLASQDALELLTERYGPDRVLYGTAAPNRDEAAPAYVLARAGIGEAARAAVSGGTARRLLRLDPAGDTPPAAPDAAADGGAVVDVVDAHAHLGRWPTCWVPRPRAGDLIAAMDRAGTTQTVFSDMLGLWSDPVAGNAAALAAAREHPGRLYVYLVVDPHRPQDADLLDAQLRDPVVRGIKVHPHTHECALDDPRYEWVWQLAVRHRVPVLGHGFAGTWHSHPSLFGSVAERHPELTLLVGHSGATVAGFRATIEVVRAHPGVYAEICGSWMTGRWLRRMVDAVGPDRVVHGTDACFIDQRYGIGRVLGAALSDAERALVLAGNARRLLAIPRPTSAHGGN